MEDLPAKSGSSPIRLPRSSGILLHISSLPSRYGIGDLGPNAYRFADFLARTGQRIWQFLPLVPVGHGNSPYSSPSTFAVNPLLISPESMMNEGLLDMDEEIPEMPENSIDFARVIDLKDRLLTRAFEKYSAGESALDGSEFDSFCAKNGYWLDDYALFMALKNVYAGISWTEWPRDLASRDPDALDEARTRHAKAIRNHQFRQFLFFRQWSRLKHYCNERSISLFGDLPIYVAHDSADVWAHQDLFYLDERGMSTVVAGVPPDYFSETGQRWGNPIYRWELMKRQGFSWWTKRFEHIFKFVDMIRLDHFRAFAGYWEIPASEETAIHGRWVEGPGAALFTAVEERLGPLPLVAENLGMITPDVTELMQEFGFPGMAVLQFAFGGDADHAFLPHNYPKNIVAYTGTHDNDTFVGWWNYLCREHGDDRSLTFARKYLGLEDGQAVHLAAIRIMLASPADHVVSPLQDVLGLDREARMNIPGRSSGNWAWRFRWEQISTDICENLKTLTAVFGRSDQLDGVIYL
ncbi:MAG: 4-alpha-glucanotransferase [Rhodothermales bacterium]